MREPLAGLLTALVLASSYIATAASAQDAVAIAERDAVPATSAWLRIDVGGLPAARLAGRTPGGPGIVAAGPQVWVGATHDLGGVGLASDVQIVGASAQLDLGVALSVGPLTLLPMAGIVLEFERADRGAIVAPQLFSVFELGPLYAEQWLQAFLARPVADASAHSVYGRQILLLSLGQVAVGAQAELAIALNGPARLGHRRVTALPVGARINVGYGDGNLLGIFLGREMIAAAREGGPGLAGRLTFIRGW